MEQAEKLVEGMVFHRPEAGSLMVLDVRGANWFTAVPVHHEKAFIGKDDLFLGRGSSSLVKDREALDLVVIPTVRKTLPVAVINGAIYLGGQLPKEVTRGESKQRHSSRIVSAVRIYHEAILSGEPVEKEVVGVAGGLPRGSIIAYLRRQPGVLGPKDTNVIQGPQVSDPPELFKFREEVLSEFRAWAQLAQSAG